MADMKWLARRDIELEEFVKFQMGGSGGGSASLNPKSQIQNPKSEDPLLKFAAEMQELAGAAMAEGRALIVASLNRAYAEGFYKGRCEGIAVGIARERKRLFATRAYWMFVGVVIAASAVTLAAWVSGF
jgi:hypothetical protein